MRQWLAKLIGYLVAGFARALTGVRVYWTPRGAPALAQTTLYFANHSSHADFVLIWATLPPQLRAQTRPVAAADYWGASRLRRFIVSEVFRAVLIERAPQHDDGADPVHQMAEALQAGQSLIMFPEGTRNMGEQPLQPLKSGIYRLARDCPGVRLVPVWIDNLKRVLPKGALVPLPLACVVRYGDPLELRADEDKASFLARARTAMLELRPDYDRQENAA
jgi:1-acyl-sn-glycerol-3-phosphate acyltransferase